MLIGMIGNNDEVVLNIIWSDGKSYKTLTSFLPPSHLPSFPPSPSCPSSFLASFPFYLPRPKWRCSERSTREFILGRDDEEREFLFEIYFLQIVSSWHYQISGKAWEQQNNSWSCWDGGFTLKRGSRGLKGNAMVGSSGDLCFAKKSPKQRGNEQRGRRWAGVLQVWSGRLIRPPGFPND